MAKFDIDDDVKVTMGMDISIGEYAPRGTVSITENGTHNVGGYAKADVNVIPDPPPLQSKTATPTESTQSIVPDENYYGLSEVTVNGISSTYVGTGVTRQSASTIVPTESVQQAVASGIYTTGPISVASISSTYIGTGVAKKSAVDLVASGSTITAPAGYYSSAVSKAIEAGSAFTPAKNIKNAPMGLGINYSTGVITASFSWSSAITPTITPGYISQGTAGTISVSGLQYQYLSVTNGRTIIPSTESQVAISTNNLAFGTIIVSAIPSEYIIPSGTSSITTNGIYDITDYASVNVSVSGGSETYTATIVEGVNHRTTIKYDGYTYMNTGATFEFSAGDTCALEAYGEMGGGHIVEDGVIIGSTDYLSPYTYTLPDCDIEFVLSTNGGGSISITKLDNIDPITITENGIYTASGTTRGYSPVTVSVPTSGFTIDDLAMHPISGSISGSASYISDRAFANWINLTDVSFSNATSIGSYAFYSCIGLTSINFTSATYIGSSAFQNCYHLSEIYFPNTTIIGDNAFYSCSLLTSADFPVASIIGNNAFRSCTALTSISFPNATSLYTSAFYYCTGLTTVDLPAAISIQASAFNNCSNLVSISIPRVTSIGGNAFQNCRSLATIVLPSVKYIVFYAFQSCYRLFSVYLLAGSKCTLSYTNVFNSTPISSYTEYTGGVNGSIFVPASLYDSYVYASDSWSYFSSRFVSLTNDEIEALLNE